MTSLSRSAAPFLQAVSYLRTASYQRISKYVQGL